jgi:hypothetical protein
MRSRLDDQAVELPSDVALEATDRFAAGLALGYPSLDVAAGAGIPTRSREDDGLQR